MNIQNKNIFPNSSLIQQLLDNYYRVDIAPTSQQDFISSHWQYYSDRFNVRLDANGNLLSLSGVGFGDCEHTKLHKKVLDWICIIAHLTHLKHSLNLLHLYREAMVVCAAMDLTLTFDVFRQICTIDLLQRHLPESICGRRMHFLMIGDGYGILSALVRKVFPNSVLVLVDLGKTLLFQSYYCQRAYPRSTHSHIREVRNLSGEDFVYCPAEQIDTLKLFKFDVAVNIASMQEMNNTTVACYFSLMRRTLRADNRFYCCNREYKQMPGGEISAIRQYPWKPEDTFWIDELCPWHQYFFSVHPTKRGLKYFGMRIPLVNFYDGEISHRLVTLATE